MSEKSSPHPAPPHVAEFAKGAQVRATFKTSAGDFVCELYADDCPVTVGNFVALARGEAPFTDAAGRTVKRPFYDGTVFHRVIKDFMVQGGDPTGTGRGGPGYRFGDEIVAHRRHDRPGILSMANAGPNTNGSQFFLTEVPTPWLDGKHTVFGAIVEGLDVLQAIAKSPVGAGDQPKTPITLQQLTIQA